MELALTYVALEIIKEYHLSKAVDTALASDEKLVKVSMNEL
ncbi:hypothetical protein [Campylobacter concisus]